jgi:hypothetical protein
MGVNFINKVKDRWRKGWTKERRKFGVRQLFSVAPRRAQKIDVVPFKSTDFCEGKPYELQVEVGRIFVYDDGRNIGVCATPPRHVVREIAALGGKTIGAFREPCGKSDRIELEVLLPSQVGEDGPNETPSR